MSTRKRSEAAIKGFDTILNTLKKPPASIEVISQTRLVNEANSTKLYFAELNYSLNSRVCDPGKE